MYTILIVDHHSIVRSGVRLLLKEKQARILVDEARNGSTAFRKILDHSYDLIMLDISLPNTDTFSLLENIRKRLPQIPILIFSVVTEYAIVKRYLQSGINGYLSKQAEDSEILHAITALLMGKKYVSPELLEQINDDKHFANVVSPFDLLSNREFEIVYQLVQGKTVSAIADSLNIHTSTVGTHKARIFDKLKVSNVFVLKDLAKNYQLI